MKPVRDLKLRKVGSKYILVEACEEHILMTDVFSMNRTAAALWMRMSEGDFTPEELAAWLCERYDVPPETALEDVRKQLDEWQRYGLLE